MIKLMLKYGAAIFMFNTFLLSIKSTFLLGEIMFLGFISVFSLVLLLNPQLIKNVLFHKAFYFFLVLNIINILYWLFFHSFTDLQAGKYLLARTTQFAIISFSVYYNFEYYKVKFLDHFSYIIFGIILISLFVNWDIISGRYSGIIWNPNALASFSVLAFSALLLNNRMKNRIDYFVLFTLLVISLSTGSRGVLLGIPLVFVFKFGFSFRNIIYAILGIFIYLIVINMQIETSINRIADQSLFSDRLLQYHYAYETLLQKPFFGHGLDKYSYVNPLLAPHYIQVVGAHNGYLSILVQYGFIFGLLVIGIVIYKSFSFFNNDSFRDHHNRFYIYVISYTLIASIYESLITGINEFHTILFWFSLAFLSYSNFRRFNEN